MVSVERVNEVFKTYIKIKKEALKQIDKMDNGANVTGSIEWKLRNRYNDEIKMLKDIRKELLY